MLLPNINPQTRSEVIQNAKVQPQMGLRGLSYFHGMSAQYERWKSTKKHKISYLQIA